MKKLINKNLYLIFGITIAVFTVLPYLFLGEDSIVTYHDQLDGELITYLLNAKYMFSNVTSYPEIMSGIPKNGMISPSPLLIVFFRFFKPFTAFCVSMLLIRIVSFVSMYFLLKEINVKEWISFLCSFFFMVLPFYTVYGLCIPGQPLLIYSLFKLYEIKKDFNVLLSSRYYLLIAFYTLGSSLALVGYVWIIILGIICIIAFIKRIGWIRYFIALIEMCVIYCTTNWSLVVQLICGNDSFVSHKSEIVHNSIPFGNSFISILKDGTSYVVSYQVFYWILIILALVLCWKCKKQHRILFLLLLASNLILSVCYSVMYSSPVIDFLNAQNGILHEFNFTRFVWIMPVIWIVLLAISISIIIDFAYDNSKDIKKGIARLYKIASVLLVSISMVISIFMALYNNDLKYNIRKIVKIRKNEDYYMITWKQFYATDLFNDVERIIGREKTEYKIASFGIYPAAASYNGYYCVDAYSNNYDVNYKHAFRKVIEPTLNQSEYLKSWFDDWGNRCYLILPDTGTYCTMEKRWTPYTDQCCFNFDELKRIGCEYIISASYFTNYEELGIELLNQNPIQTDDSWYRLWVYKI